MGKLVEEALKLSVEERLALAEKLLESVDGPDDDPDRVQAAWASELEKRARELRDGTSKGLSVEEARKRVAFDSDDDS
jgi:putative addiction module component (TIGR02574 family)